MRWFAEFVPGRRGEILDAAVAVFSAKGYDAGTMRQIASAVGVTEPALYRHWPGKEALFDDLIATAGDHVVGQARTMLAAIEPDSLRPGLETLLRMPLAESERGRMALMRAVLAAAPNHPAFIETFRARIALPMQGEIRAAIARLDGELGVTRAPGEADACVRVLMSLFVGHMLTTQLLGAGGAEAATADAVLAVLGWEGVR